MVAREAETLKTFIIYTITVHALDHKT